MERGQNNLTAVQEVKQEFGITVHPIVTVADIIAHLHNREVNGKIFIDNNMRDKMEAYIEKYCAL
jgi:orotate phosphoribosyltransferase